MCPSERGDASESESPWTSESMTKSVCAVRKSSSPSQVSGSGATAVPPGTSGRDHERRADFVSFSASAGVIASTMYSRGDLQLAERERCGGGARGCDTLARSVALKLGTTTFRLELEVAVESPPIPSPATSSVVAGSIFSSTRLSEASCCSRREGKAFGEAPSSPAAEDLLLLTGLGTNCSCKEVSFGSAHFQFCSGPSSSTGLSAPVSVKPTSAKLPVKSSARASKLPRVSSSKSSAGWSSGSG